MHIPLYNNIYFDISSLFWPKIYKGVHTFVIICITYMYYTYIIICVREVWYNENLSMKFLYFPEFFSIGKYEKLVLKLGDMMLFSEFLKSKIKILKKLGM